MVRKILYIFFTLISIKANSQNALLDEIKLMDNQRNIQLLGSVQDSNVIKGFSFMTRSTSAFQFLEGANYTNSKKLKIKSFQLSDIRQNNDHLPIGFNDGSMYPAVGQQERVSIGLNVRWRALDINIQPEWVSAQNLQQFVDKGNQTDGNWWPRYYLLTANNIDDFRRFGKEAINEYTLGQSRIGLSYPGFALGVSNENLWWGPARLNSLLFTNHAPGFKHAYFQTQKPLKTLVGSFEFKAIMGLLDSTKYENPDDSIMRTIWRGGIYPKSNSARNINAFIINWQPKWIQNLYIGYAYSKIMYSDSNAISNGSEKMGVGVLMARFVMPKDHAEFYAELGTPNQLPWPTRFFTDTARPGFTIGARKIFPNLKRNSFLEFSVELTQLQLMDPRQVFTPRYPFDGPQYNSWYTSTQIKQGYTSNAQMLGASIGPGSNTQSMSLSWNKGYNKIGLHVQRLVHNNDFYNYVYLSSVGYGKANAYWVDLMSGLEVQLNPQKNLIIAASVLNTQTMNWRWVRIEDNKARWSEPTSKTPDKFNLQLNVSIKVLFNGAH
jgi:hypothetical protein